MSVPPIKRFYVAACALDFLFTRRCVASIRYWYPKIPITLILDYYPGEVDARSLIRDWNLELFDTPIRNFGFCFSKLEPLFLAKKERYVMLDSDIVLLGPVLDTLNATAGDFVVDPEHTGMTRVEELAYDCRALASFDPAFVRPDYFFNAGQYVGTSGLLNRADFDSMVEWSSPRRPRHPEIFKCGEQGMTNYVLFKTEAAGRISLARRDFYFHRKEDTSAITVEQIARRASPPFLLHWAGNKLIDIDELERTDILAFYTSYFHRGRSWATWWEELPQSVRNWGAKMREALWLAGLWLRGTPRLQGGRLSKVDPKRLTGFFDAERKGTFTWRWSQPEASINLLLARGNYRVRIETGSPFPMSGLGDAHPRFFINGVSIPPDRIKIYTGVAEVDLDARELREGKEQILGWAMDRLTVGTWDQRALGMPVSALWVFRRRA